MTDVSRQHAAAAQNMIELAVAGEAQGGRYKVYLGEVTDDEADVRYPYLVVWPPPVMRPTNTLAGYDSAATSTIQVTAAGVSVDEVLAALDRAAAALHRRRPQITGRVCGLISQVPGAVPPAPQRDDKVSTPAGRPVFYSFALFSMYSTER
jgi:hypothetical protein